MPNDARRKRAPRFWVDVIEYAIHKEKGRDHRGFNHAHAVGEMVYVDYGRLRLKIGDQHLTLGPGDCVILAPRVRHALSSVAGQPFDFLNVVYKGRVPRSLMGRVLRPTAEERRFLSALKEEGEQGLPHHEPIMLHYLNTCLRLIDRREKLGRPAAPLEPENRLQHRSRMVDRALADLLQHVSHPLDAQALAQRVGVSASHLRAMLKRETGMSLRQHLRRMRVDMARRMLRESPDNVDAICYRVGYRSVPHFCTVFKRETKMTPSEYARSIG